MILKNRPYMKEGDAAIYPKKSFYVKKIHRNLWWQKLLRVIWIDLMVVEKETKTPSSQT